MPAQAINAHAEVMPEIWASWARSTTNAMPLDAARCGSCRSWVTSHKAEEAEKNSKVYPRVCEGADQEHQAGAP
jgi:NADH:ubiquinone oxidoreductase subunit